MPFALDEPQAGRLTIQYAPNDATEITENPPRFTWLPVLEDEARYVLRVAADPGFASTKTRLFTQLPLNVFVPDRPFAAGTYHWQYAVRDRVTGEPASTQSTARWFEIARDLPETPLPARSARFAAAPQSRPRPWLTAARLAAFADARDPDHCAWSTFLEASARPWMDRDIMAEPAGYPDHNRTATIWWQT